MVLCRLFTFLCHHIVNFTHHYFMSLLENCRGLDYFPLEVFCLNSWLINIFSLLSCHANHHNMCNLKLLLICNYVNKLANMVLNWYFNFTSTYPGTRQTYTTCISPLFLITVIGPSLLTSDKVSSAYIVLQLYST